jgi:hypothetical protein
MPILPFAGYTISSHLTPDEINARLKAYLGKKKSERLYYGNVIDDKFEIGNIMKHAMTVARHPHSITKKSETPYVSRGVISPSETGSTISIKIRSSRMIYFMQLFTLCMALLCFRGICINPDSTLKEILIGLFIMLALPVGIYFAFFYGFGTEVRRSKQLFINLFEGEEISN